MLAIGQREIGIIVSACIILIAISLIVFKYIKGKKKNNDIEKK